MEISKGDVASSNTTSNARGIPVAPFVDDVEDYVASRDEVENTLRSFQEMISQIPRPWKQLLS